MIRIIVLSMLICCSIAQDCQQVGCASGFCCSKWGYCGDTPLHCDTDRSRWNTTYDGTCQGACAPGYCCSRWGYCGDSPLHCSTAGYWNGTYTSTCEPACAPGFCCSKWGFCGNSELHCQNNNTGNAVCDPPCRPGSCCSKWGYCGESELHCTTNGTNPVTDNGRCSPACPSWQCCSKWGYCGSSMEHCDQTPGPTSNETTMTRQRFDCIFDQLSPSLRDKRWQGYQQALSLVSFQPQNQDELMMFFAHVSHETDGLKTYEEYCGQSGACANDYQDSWCPPVQGQPGKTYYGRGWFQLSWPCNYHDAGQALGLDFLQNPEQVAESDVYAAATAMWFWKANNMGESARHGNFAETTRKINKIECGNTPQQTNRIERYQKVRQCFGVSRETINLRCY